VSGRLLPRALGAVRRVTAHVPPTLLEVDGFVVFELPPLEPEPMPGVSGLALGPDDLPRLAACRSMQDPREGVRLFSRRLAEGSLAFGLSEGDELLGYVWGRLGAYVPEDRDRYRMDLAPTDAYLFDAWLHPWARGRGLFELLTATAQARLAGLGARRFLSTVALTNAVSLAVHARIGARPLETVGFLHVPGLTVHASHSPLGLRAQLGDRAFVSHATRSPEIP
jgi:ribosomal protein S18 acetylase RimI-like enzyme